jgi:small subunit ribosomal protein S17
MRDNRKTMVGRVVSDSMDKTVVVLVESLRRHRLYGKVIKTRKKYFAHDDGSSSHVGDLVRIEESRPFSKRKRWLVTDVLERSQ